LSVAYDIFNIAYEKLQRGLYLSKLLSETLTPFFNSDTAKTAFSRTS